MSAESQERAPCGDSRARFAATHWSVVLAASQGDDSRRAEALETLCRTYWEPLYAYLRRLDYPVHDAQDFTQGLFAYLLSQDWLAGVSPAKGKFRTFLLTALKNFVANERVRASAAKRGGRQEIVPLDQTLAEPHLAQESQLTPSAEAHFDRQWALTILKNAHGRLQQAFAAAGKADYFAQLSVFLTREAKDDEYETVGAKLGLTPGAVAVAVHRLRQRWRNAIRAEVAHTVSTPAELDEEMRYLLEILIADA